MTKEEWFSQIGIPNQEIDVPKKSQAEIDLYAKHKWKLKLPKVNRLMVDEFNQDLKKFKNSPEGREYKNIK